MFRLVLLCAAATLFATGCGFSGPETVPVTGTVLYRGQPVEGAMVVFQPVAAGPDVRPAGATSEPDGSFTLTTSIGAETYDGATPSEYLVAVEKDVTKYESISFEKYAAEMQAGRDPVPKRKNVLPEKYADPATSNLRYTVSADSENNFTIELVD
jgi:hypothetical protein